MSSLDSKLDLSLDELIKQAAQAKRPVVKSASVKPASAGSRSAGLAPKQIGVSPIVWGVGVATASYGSARVFHVAR